MRLYKEGDFGPQARCDYCGKPGKWETEMYGSSYLMGRVICTECAQPFGVQMALLSTSEKDSK